MRVWMQIIYKDENKTGTLPFWEVDQPFLHFKAISQTLTPF